jgi:hypothetical protein
VSGFLLWIGLYNVLGALFVLAFLRPPFAQKVLGTWLQLLGVAYSHGEHGPLWIWWASLTNLALGAIMMLASRWPAEPQQGITVVVVAVYAIMSVVALFAARSRRYAAKGIYGTLVLWVAQIAWGAIGFARSL